MGKRDRKQTDSLPKKKAREKPSENVVCVICDKDASKDSIECECCFNWVHRECAGLSIEEFQVLGNSSSNIMFFCNTCQPKATIALKFFNEIEDKQKSLEAKLLNLKTI